MYLYIFVIFASQSIVVFIISPADNFFWTFGSHQFRALNKKLLEKLTKPAAYEAGGIVKGCSISVENAHIQ